jgi:hypothetical protein
MPSSKPKPSEIAAEAKKVYIPYIREKCPDWPTESYLIEDAAGQIIAPPPEKPLRCRIGK